jgi:hypothetical protein
MKINKIIIAIAFLPLISIAQEAKSQNNPQYNGEFSKKKLGK